MAKWTLNEERLGLVKKHCELWRGLFPKADSPSYVVNRPNAETLSYDEVKILNSLNRHPEESDAFYVFVDVCDFYELARRGYLVKHEGPYNSTDFNYA